MSDTADELGFEGRQLLNKSKLNQLRERMRTFVSNHEGDKSTLRELRREASGGRSLSADVVEDREERL